MITSDPIDAEVTRLRKFVESIVDANGPYPSLNGTPVVAAAYTALNPVAKEHAPPVTQRLQDEISANFMRSIPSARPPLFFRETTTGVEWEFRNGKMTVEDGEESLFSGPEELLEELDVIEVDEFGEPLRDSAEDIDAERGDRAGKLQREEES